MQVVGLTYDLPVRRDREILESAVKAVAEQAAKVDQVIDEALAAGLGGSDPLTVSVKTIRLELLGVKGELERQLEQLVVDCSSCGRLVHWVPGLGVVPGHWAHREPAPHHEPAV